MSNLAISDLQTISTTGPLTPTGGLDVSAVKGECTVHVRITRLFAASAVPAIALVLEDSVNGFTAAVQVAERQFSGQVSSPIDLCTAVGKYEMTNCRFGSPNAVLRANVVSIRGTSPSCSLQLWLEQ